MKKRKSSFLITFEGIENSGKSTHIKRMSSFLSDKGLKVEAFREPGSTRIGEKIRNILLDKSNSIDNYAEFLLYMAARVQFIKESLEDALKNNDVVLCDRFYDSTLVYQGYALGLGLKEIKPFVEFFSFYIKPDITFVLDIKPKEALGGIENKDRIESRPLEFHRKVREGYIMLSQMEPQRIKIIKRGTREEVDKKVISFLEKLIWK